MSRKRVIRLMQEEELAGRAGRGCLARSRHVRAPALEDHVSIRIRRLPIRIEGEDHRRLRTSGDAPNLVIVGEVTVANARVSPREEMIARLELTLVEFPALA